MTKERKRSEKKANRQFSQRLAILTKVFFLLWVLFFLVAAWGTLIHPLTDGTSIYSVTADVEQIRVKTHDNIKANWFLNDASITYNCTDESPGVCFENEDGEKMYRKPKFSGSLHLANNVDITFTRVGYSNLIIQLSASSEHKKASDSPEATDSKIGDLYSESEEYVDTMTGFASIVIGDLEHRFKNGESPFFNVSGDIHLADTKDYPDSHIKPILTGGEVSILEKPFLFGFLGENYLIGPYQLSLGNSIEFTDQVEAAEGFVVVAPSSGSDSSSGLKTNFSVEAVDGTITGYKFDGYSVSASIWNRLFNDQILSYLWMLFAFFISIFLFLYEIAIETKDENK